MPHLLLAGERAIFYVHQDLRLGEVELGIAAREKAHD
jgi:hypothetical protein